MAKVTVKGNLGRDPQMSYCSKGNARCNYTLAENRSYKTSTGEQQKKTVWHNITSWGKRAEIDAKHLKKGARVTIEGDLEYYKVPIAEGKTVQTASIKARNVEFHYIPRDEKEQNNTEE